jgi:DNA-binding response OmpR family regulator
MGFAHIVERALGTEGFDVTVVSSGGEGIDAARSDYELVLLDLLLPDADGLSVLRRLLDERPEQQVMVMSSISDVEARVRSLDAGAADYLAKPFALNELVARVRARVRAADTDARTAKPTVAGILDFKHRSAAFDGGVAHLSAREFFLLEYLMRREGETCTREEILEAVWNITFDPGTNVVDVYVRRLRRKIGEPRIETVRNVGYCFLAP